MDWFWTIWLVLGVLGTFGIAECYAIVTHKPTLSRYVWTVSKAFPAFPWIIGVVVGFLACHFWWGGAICFQTP
jgi:hypothetical protein